MTFQVHGMDGAPADPTWAPLSSDEVTGVLAHYGWADAELTWHSPRPMAASGLARSGSRTVFVKRFSPEVRDQPHLEADHAFIRWLGRRGVPVPEVLATAEGATVVVTPGGIYEVQAPVPGEDRYREAMSWTGYATAADAAGAGRMLARLHDAAEGFEHPPHPPGLLTDSVAVVGAPDPWAALLQLVDRRPRLQAFLAGRDWPTAAEEALAAPLRAAAAAGMADAAPLWTHGDWHPSNLSWAGTEVAGVFDFGLANRTFALHDLAVAVERACVTWLESAWRIDRPALDALLQGYESVRPLTSADRARLAALLPVVHVEYALSEIEYFSGPAGAPEDAELAWSSYLLGHARWLDNLGRTGQNVI